jgi:hypothetical protein
MYIQEMIPRTKLQAALSESESLRAENQIISSKMISLESQVAMAQHQLGISAAEKAELRSAMMKMVPKYELTDLEARNVDLREQAVKAGREHRQAIEQLQEMVAQLESDKTKLLISMQVWTHSGIHISESSAYRCKRNIVVNVKSPIHKSVELMYTLLNRKTYEQEHMITSALIM